MRTVFDCLPTCVNYSVNKIWKNNIIPELNIHDESMIMLSASLTIYLVADLRELARKGKATVGIEELLEPSITVGRILDLIKANKKALIENAGYYDDELEGRIIALENLTTRDSNSMIIGSYVVGKNTRVVEFVDNNSKEELVHAITVNDVQMRITVTFRGSVTRTDFIVDAKVTQKKVENPVHKSDLDTPKTMNIHSGFYDYLFSKQCPNNPRKSRIQSILDEVHILLAQNPSYSLHVTGHSLGGALCTLFGFYAAANETTHVHLHGPVKIVSIASPYVGNFNFLLAFQSLERRGKLQHLRIANSEDVVTLMPVIAPKMGMMISPAALTVISGVANMYKHCGMKLQMKRKAFENGKTFRISYPQDHQSSSTEEYYAKEITNLMEDGKSFINSLKKVVTNEVAVVTGYHSCEEYERRLNNIKPDLRFMSLNALYEDKKIVGNISDFDHHKSVMLESSTKDHIDYVRGGSSKKIQNTVFGRKKSSSEA